MYYKYNASVFRCKDERSEEYSARKHINNLIELILPVG